MFTNLLTVAHMVTCEVPRRGWCAAKFPHPRGVLHNGLGLTQGLSVWDTRSDLFQAVAYSLLRRNTIGLDLFYLVCKSKGLPVP